MQLSVSKYLCICMLFTLGSLGNADDDAIKGMVNACNQKNNASQCIKTAEYYKSRWQMDLAYKYYKKACNLDKNSQSNGLSVCNLAKNLEKSFPDNLFKSN